MNRYSKKVENVKKSQFLNNPDNYNKGARLSQFMNSGTSQGPNLHSGIFKPTGFSIDPVMINSRYA